MTERVVVVQVQVVLVVGLVVVGGVMVVLVLYSISPTLAPLPVLIRYVWISGAVRIRYGSIPGAVPESVKWGIVEVGVDGSGGVCGAVVV